jgi:hypothetical protein
LVVGAIQQPAQGGQADVAGADEKNAHEGGKREGVRGIRLSWRRWLATRAGS